MNSESVGSSPSTYRNTSISRGTWSSWQPWISINTRETLNRDQPACQFGPAGAGFCDLECLRLHLPSLPFLLLPPLKAQSGHFGPVFPDVLRDLWGHPCQADHHDPVSHIHVSMKSRRMHLQRDALQLQGGESSLNRRPVQICQMAQTAVAALMWADIDLGLSWTLWPS